jgi:hypothetical protein
MDLSRTYIQTSWECYVPCPVKLPEWKIISRIFFPSALLSILLAIMLANIVVVLLARFGFKEYESFRHIMDAIMDVWALILGVFVSP